ncbi:MAG: type II secretion system protein GspG [Holophagales bacterium]|nr:type II secretion system protein GspG [Holophagales bacterium]MBK9964175.1 type II secretion system protein GspG [Holophagales bacterium]
MLRAKAPLVAAVTVLGLVLVGCDSAAVRNAQKYVDVKEYGKARELLDLEIKGSPKNVDAYLMLGRVLLIEMEPDAAAVAFDKALLLSSRAKGKIARAYLDAAKAIWDDRDKTSKRNALETISLYLNRATNYEPDSGKLASSWALEVAEKAVVAERTTAPISLLVLAGKFDPDGRRKLGEFCFRLAKSYQEKSFLPEAIGWALAAGELSPDQLKGAARILRDAAILLPLPQEKNVVEQAFGKAKQWDPSLEEDDDVFWLTRVTLAQGPGGIQEYLAKFPAGKHTGEARPLAEIDLFRKAMGEIRSMATAVEAYAVDMNRYPGRLGTGSPMEGKDIVAPVYIKSLPERDPWGAPYLYEVDPQGLSYRFTSGGSDRILSTSSEPLPATPSLTGSFPLSSAGEDIVFQNGQFVRWPEGIQR